MLKTVLFGFMANGYISLRELEDQCKVNLRFMYLMDHQTPSYHTFGHFYANQDSTYGFYPKYPVADAGYGSYNNYIFCEQHGMKKYMKFPMFKKETTDKKYHEDPFRAVNFPIGKDGIMRCLNGKKFYLQYRKNVKGNKYGRQEEVYQCEDCSSCPYAEQCKKTDKNRTVRINRELTAMHQEVIENLESIQGALLRMNRSIQAEGTFGIMKNDRWYKRYAEHDTHKAVSIQIVGTVVCGMVKQF